MNRVAVVALLSVVFIGLLVLTALMLMAASR